MGVELGVKFRSDLNGVIRGIKFYKGNSQNAGPHVVNLWTAGGSQLATATVVNETASGWQQANFATPVSIESNKTYVASYYAPRDITHSIKAIFFRPAGMFLP